MGNGTFLESASDFQTPLDLYIYVRELFSSGKSYHLTHPWLRTYPPLQALNALANRIKEPFVPTLDHPLPIALSCQLALLWAILGLQQEASRLASSLKPLVDNGFTTLWTPEREYNEKESLDCFSLLKRALNATTQMEEPTDPFLAWLYHKNPRIDLLDTQPKDYTIQDGIVLCSSHHHAFQSGGAIQIPAFGPHTAPLSNAGLFGIANLVAKDGWFCSAGSKEVWFNIDSVGGGNLSLQTIGIDPEQPPVHFVFYVKAGECKIGDKIFRPRNLARFSGDATTVCFVQGTETLEISVDQALLLELIPLAGSSSYWGASFLLSFKLPTLMSRIAFKLLGAKS